MSLSDAAPPARRVMGLLLPAFLLTSVLAVPTAHAATVYPSGVGADLGPVPTTLGVRPAAGDDPAGLRTGTEQGRTYWQTNQAVPITTMRLTGIDGRGSTTAGRAATRKRSAARRSGGNAPRPHRITTKLKPHTVATSAASSESRPFTRSAWPHRCGNTSE